jgi:hypothetical protein
LTLKVERNRNAATRCSSFQVTNIFLNFSNDLAALAGFSTAAATAATMLRIKHHSRIRSTSLSLISSFVRSRQIGLHKERCDKTQDLQSPLPGRHGVKS